MQGKRPSAALLISMVALIVALGGTSVALEGRNTVDRNDIKRNAVGAKQIRDRAVAGGEIADGAVDSADVASAAIVGNLIAVGSAKIPDNAVGLSEVATNAIESDEIATAAVDSDELRDNSVQSDELADGVVTPNKTDLTQFSSASDPLLVNNAAQDAVPPITINARAGDLLEYMAYGTVRRSTGMDTCTYRISVDYPGGSGSIGIIRSTSGSSETRYMTFTDAIGGTAAGDGSLSPAFAQARTVPVAVDGTYTISLQGQGTSLTLCDLTGPRGLWVMVER
jgi:hypothetical protein